MYALPVFLDVVLVQLLPIVLLVSMDIGYQDLLVHYVLAILTQYNLVKHALLQLAHLAFLLINYIMELALIVVNNILAALVVLIKLVHNAIMDIF
jgi:hypothetical protein